MSNELIFWIGIGAFATAVLILVIALIVAKIKWIQLERKMDQEYGVRA